MPLLMWLAIAAALLILSNSLSKGLEGVPVKAIEAVSNEVASPIGNGLGIGIVIVALAVSGILIFVVYKQYKGKQ